MLSDACFDFLHRVREATAELGNAVHWYADPDNPLDYGEEIDALRRACLKAGHEPIDVEALGSVLKLAAAVMDFHDAAPDSQRRQDREREMLKLVALLRPVTTPEEKPELPPMVGEVGADGEAGEAAAGWLLRVLPRLAKPAYEAAVKIIADIGSATVKRMLGL